PQEEEQAHGQMDRQKRPEQRPGHVLDEGPEPVAGAVIDAERAVAADRGRADVADDGVADLDAAAAGEAQAEGEVVVLAIAEVPFVEAALGKEGVPPVESR